MTQDKARPTPPAVPSEREAFKDWFRKTYGREPDPLRFADVGKWIAWEARALAAPVASNTTAEPAPIQPAGVEVEGVEAVRAKALEEAAQAVEQHDRAGREWIPNSLWGQLSAEASARIRALAGGAAK